MAVKGNLSEIPLTNLVQLNCQTGATGRLTVVSKNNEARIFFENGDIVHVVSGKQSGQEVFYEILGWETGIFELNPGVPAPTRTINANCADLLLGGLHQLDESSPADQTANSPEPLPDDLGKLFGLQKLNPPKTGEQSTEDIMAQNMQEILVALSGDAPGLFVAVVAGMDGLPIADYAHQSVNVDEASAQMTLLIKLVETTMQKLDAGTIQDYLLTTDKAYLLIRFLGDDNRYYLGIGADRNKTNLGKMRLYSRIYAERLSAVMPR